MTNPILNPVTHEEAMKFIADKPAVTREVFNKLLPELKARAFTISGIESINVMQRVRDRIADLPRGVLWDDIKDDIVSEVSPWLVTSEDPEIRKVEEGIAERRAELLLRTHGFEAYQAAQYEVMTEQADIFPYWQYLTVGDESVRDEHSALDGLVLPASSSFWADHYPPWDWGCRCQVVSLLPEERDEIAKGEAKGVVLSPLMESRLEKSGILNDADGRPINVSSPAKSGKEGAFSWTPGDLRVSLDDLKARYDKETFSTFQKMAEGTELEPGTNLWQWLEGKALKTAAELAGGKAGVTTDLAAAGLSWLKATPVKRILAAEAEMTGLSVERAIGFDRNGKQLFIVDGAKNSVEIDAADFKKAAKSVVTHYHPDGGSFSPDDLEQAFTFRLKELRAVTPNGVYSIIAAGDQFDPRQLENIRRAWKRLEKKDPVEALKQIAKENGFTFGWKGTK